MALIFKRYRLIAACLHASVEVVVELSMTVAVTETDGKKEGFAASAKKIGDVVGADAM